MNQLQRQISRLERLIQHYQRQLEISMNWRLIFGLATFLIILVSAALPQQAWVSLVVLLPLFLFIFYFLKTKNLKRHLIHLTSWQQLLARQEQRKSGQYQQPFNESELRNLPTDLRTRAKDLHLLGETSLLSQIDETLTLGGHQKLIEWILDPKMSPEQILERQNQIQELNRSCWPLIKLKIQTDSHLTKLATDTLSSSMNDSLTGEKFQLYALGHTVLYPLAWVFTILSAQKILPISTALPFTLYFLYFIISKGQILDSFQRTEGLSVHLGKLRNLFEFVEKHFSTPALCNSLPTIFKAKPSKELKFLSRYAAALSVVGHPIVYLIVNILFPWDYVFTFLAEKWRVRWSRQFPQILQELHQFEVLVSGVLFYRFQTSTFPKISQEMYFEFQNLYHPLIDHNRVVKNSWTLPKQKNLILITGSNMSGKSTFLRTFGLNHQLAQMGAPVFADSMVTTLAPLYTCLQVADSLEAGYSTFYYEVRQISQMIVKAQKGEQFIFLIDEIFRGTNNRERLIGSQSVIQEMVSAPHAVGFITTHDLELTQLESQFSSLTNWHFKDDVNDNQLTFSYKIQQGPCPTTNALKIMANEGLPVPLN